MAWKQGTSAPFGSWSYTHNQRGQRLTSTDATGRAATYTYDSAARLASETISGDPRGGAFNGALSYLLDGAGNRSSRTSTLTALGNQSLTYNADDELDSDAYDANGNTTSSGGHSFAYDFENRLVSKDNGAVTLQYNCDGDRVAKTVAGVTTQYLVDDLNPTGYAQVLEELAGGAVQRRYTYGTSVVSQTRNASSAPLTSYYGYDGHGNITFLTDATGAVTDSYDYDAWGNILAATGSTPNSRLYTGEEFDLDLGFINLRARQYEPTTGRFSTLDPIDGALHQPLTWNRYLYAGLDPVNLRDPLGLEAEAEGVLTGGIAGPLIKETTITIIRQGARIVLKGMAVGAAAAVIACDLVLTAQRLALLSAVLTGDEVPPPPTMAACDDPCRPGWNRCIRSRYLRTKQEDIGKSRCAACLLLCEGLGYWPVRLPNGNACIAGADGRR